MLEQSIDRRMELVETGGSHFFNFFLFCSLLLLQRSSPRPKGCWGSFIEEALAVFIWFLGSFVESCISLFCPKQRLYKGLEYALGAGSVNRPTSKFW